MNDFVSKVEGSVRPRHLGLGFVWAWIYCSFSTSALFAGRVGSSINADSSWFASAVAVVGCFFVFAIAWRRADMSRMRPAAFVGTALMAAGTFFLGAFDLPAWSGTLCGVASGIGSGLLVLFWGDAYSRLETERVEIAVPAASGVMLACAFVFPYIQGLPGACGVSSLPILSMVCLYLTWSDIDAGRFVERLVEKGTWHAEERAGLRTSAAHILDATQKGTREVRSLGSGLQRRSLDSMEACRRLKGKRWRSSREYRLYFSPRTWRLAWRLPPAVRPMHSRLPMDSTPRLCSDQCAACAWHFGSSFSRPA